MPSSFALSGAIGGFSNVSISYRFKCQGGSEHKQKSQLDLMLYNIQHKIEQLQQVIMKQKF